MSSKNDKVCLVSCSVLKAELQKLVREGKLDADLVFVSKNWHVDYNLVEQNVRKVLDHTLKRYPGRVVLVYGDLCMGQDNEMKRLAKEYHIIKVDALNCIDCQLGGKGKSEEADPTHKLMFMGPGMVDFFKYGRELFAKQGVDEETYKKMFNGIDGFVILDTVGNGEELKRDLEELGMGVRVLETRKIGSENVRLVVLDAIEKTIKR
ncbi:MAG: DUF1638 domain-containing protein [Candidatus Bathyarchaeia archaeon]|jgi:hypothetical protein